MHWTKGSTILKKETESTKGWEIHSSSGGGCFKQYVMTTHCRPRDHHTCLLEKAATCPPSHQKRGTRHAQQRPLGRACTFMAPRKGRRQFSPREPFIKNKSGDEEVLSFNNMTAQDFAAQSRVESPREVQWLAHQDGENWAGPHMGIFHVNLQFPPYEPKF